MHPVYYVLFSKKLCPKKHGHAAGVPIPCGTHVRHKHTIDMLKTVSDTSCAVSNKIKKKTLCYCCVRTSCRLYLKKRVKWSGEIKNIIKIGNSIYT